MGRREGRRGNHEAKAIKESVDEVIMLRVISEETRKE
jgi:hypothetical protein